MKQDKYKNIYRLKSLTLRKAIFSGPNDILVNCMVIGMVIVMWPISLELSLVGLIFLAIGYFLSIRRYLEANRIEVATSDDGLTLYNKKFYSWQNIERVAVLPLKGTMYEHSLPGYELYFTDGKTHIITQRLDDYTGLYQELYQNKISGAENILPLYKVEIIGGHATEGIRPAPRGYYDPKKDKLTMNS